MRGKLCLQCWFIAVATIVLTCCQQTINYPGPRIATVSPTSISAGQPTFTLTATGYNFTPASTVNWNGGALITLFVNTNTLTAQVSSGLIQNAAAVSITVSTPSPGGGVTAPIAFTIKPTASPLPHITSISPSSVLTRSGAFALSVTGTNFVALSNVLVSGSIQTTTFESYTSLLVSVPASYVASTGSLQVVVVNPPPDGGSSNTFTLTITNPVPSIASLNPTSGQAGTTSTVVSLTGTAFVPDSGILINGVGRTTSFASSTQLSTELIASDFAAAGIDQVQVVNPGPGGGTSNTLTFAVNPTKSAGLPVLVDIAPDGSQANNGICGGINSCQSGSQGLTLTTASPSVSQTGQFVAFASISNNLVAKQTNSSSEIFYRNTCLTATSGGCTPATFLLSTAANGGLPNGPSSEPSLDGSGTHAAYTSLATNLVNYVNMSSGPAASEVYWQPVCTTTAINGVPTCATTGSATSTSTAPAVLVSVAVDEASPGNGNSYNPVISPDGQYVAFVSLATNLVSNVAVDGVTPQVYIRTICGGAIPTTVNPTCHPTTYLVSSSDGIHPGNGPGSHPAISNNGLYVSFSSSATNLGTAAPNPQGAEEIFRRSTCSTTIGQAGNTCAPATTLISTPDASITPTAPAGGANSEPAISYDGRFVAFASTAANLGTASAGVQQIYVRDTCTAATSCTPSTRLVSTRDGTTPANALSESPSMNRIATGSGPLVAFASAASNLATNVLNGVESIFVRNTCAVVASSTACSAGLALTSQPAGTSPPAANGLSIGPAISGDGHTVAFLSFASDLVVRDDNALEDIFLASTSF